MNKTERPKVSVCVVTYNQENYIRECLQSLVDQKTTFSFEVIVSDDKSTDRTPEIVREFARKYPQIVRPVLREKNIGAYGNFVESHLLAEGEYIAHVDGDDYALPGKLQKQADYLDANPQCNIVWHRIRALNSEGILRDDGIKFKLFPKNKFFRSDILKFITVGVNSSKMYRASCREFQIPGFPVMDFFANVEQIKDGYGSMLESDPLGVYRLGVGIVSESSGEKVTRILLESMKYFYQKYPEFRLEISTGLLITFLAALKNRRWRSVVHVGKALAMRFNIASVPDIIRVRKYLPLAKLPKF